MAITNTCLRFFLFCKKQGVSFSSTLTLGRLENRVTKNIDILQEGTGSELIDAKRIQFDEKYGESIFYALGAAKTESLDFSDYENADLKADLNEPVPNELHDKYSVVVDGGTLEHVFNFPQAVLNCMNLIKTGGHFIGFSPTNNLMGHGFYQFSPELFYRVFSPENGFADTQVFIISAGFETDTQEMYAVSDPQKLQNRVTLAGEKPSYLLVVSRKISKIPSPFLKVYQSDYSLLWKGNPLNESDKQKNTFLKKVLNKIWSKIRNPEKSTDLEKYNAGFFKKIRF